MTRREFIRNSATGIATLSGLHLLSSCQGDLTGRSQEDEDDPFMRSLGRTGLKVSMLSFGGGSQFLKNEGESEWKPLLERAVEYGINYFDTAYTYGDGESERRYGTVLSQVRRQIYIETKVRTRIAAEVRPTVEKSLDRLRTDYVDVLLIHGVEETDSYANIADEIYPEIAQLKKDGIARFIGLSVMSAASFGKRLIDSLDFDVAFIAMNPTQYGQTQEITLPAARQKDLGILAMKALRDIVDEYATAKELLFYVLDREGVASVVVGHQGMNELNENVAIVKEYVSLQRERSFNFQKLEERLEPYAGPHALSWANPHYEDC